jgi:hypothetical protein
MGEIFGDDQGRGFERIPFQKFDLLILLQPIACFVISFYHISRHSIVTAPRVDGQLLPF